MTNTQGPGIEEDFRWDTAAAFTITPDTPWDILRAQILWAIWCQRVDVAFRNEQFHLGLIFWHAWHNTIYCAMEAYKELFRHPCNEEKRQQLIDCFQKVWTAADIFGRLRGGDIKWNLTPHAEFLLREFGAWTTPPIQIHRLAPSPTRRRNLQRELTSHNSLMSSFKALRMHRTTHNRNRNPMTSRKTITKDPQVNRKRSKGQHHLRIELTPHPAAKKIKRIP
jgi:hypothetical protein